MEEDRRDQLREQLASIAEELADMAHAELREIADGGAQASATAERRLSSARRAVLKAASLLGDPGDQEGT
ncbi:MAG TPA: hypothetical protein VME46_09565 [Acidimicrobiales bacterium]|nr:hypothetical protein [Acidimicrobiales bacterium]